VLAYVVAHPAHAALHGLERIYDLLYRVVPFFGAVGSVEPNYPIYRGLVRACALWWLLNLAAFVSSVLLPRASGRASPAWATSTGALIMAMSGSIFFLAIGDHGEEYRFLISILPLFAALPECRPWRFPIAAALDSAPSPNGRREAQGWPRCRASRSRSDGVADQVRIPCTTFPNSSVRRKSRPR